jgi:two-component system alkaline phosphatase synthesis response regulator PhoP
VSPRILVVDDELPIVELLSYNLKRANYEVLIARDGEEAVRQARQEQPDLVILDLMLPKMDGLEVCRTLRRERDVPIIMLTARDSEVDRVVGLELGADDYVVKPFSVRELLARVRNVLHRAKPRAGEAGREAVCVGPLSVDPTRYEARLGAVLLELPPLEFELLYTMARHAGQVLRREQLLQQVWQYDNTGDLRLVDSAVKRLRARLRQAAPGTELIDTVRGVGYKLGSD